MIFTSKENITNKIMLKKARKLGLKPLENNAKIG